MYPQYSLETGQTSFAEILEIQKAFEAGQDYVVESMVGGQAGRVQSLQGTFVDMTNFEKVATFYKMLPAETVTSPVLEHAQIREIGGSIFMPEGGDVPWQQDDMVRKVDFVKYLGVKASVTELAMMTKMINPAANTEFQNKTRSLIRGIDQALIDGDSEIDPYSFDGIFKQVKAKSRAPKMQVIDMKGRRLHDNVLQTGVTRIKLNLGYGPYHLFTSPTAIEGFTKDRSRNKRLVANAGGDINPTGLTFDKFGFANGMGKVVDDIFFEGQSALVNRIVSIDGGSLIKNNSYAPDAPTVSISSEASPYVDNYELETADYEYAIVPVNSYGRGLGYETGIMLAGTGKRVKFQVTAAGTGNVATGYEIYRRPMNSNDARDYKFVAKFKKTGTVTTLYDDGQYIAGASRAVMIELDKEQVCSVASYGDYMKLLYGRVADRTDWLLKKYMTLWMKNVGRVMLYENIGDIPNTDAELMA